MNNEEEINLQLPNIKSPDVFLFDNHPSVYAAIRAAIFCGM